MKTKMEIKSNDLRFVVIEDNKEIASIILYEKGYSLSFTTETDRNKEKEHQIDLLYELQKNTTYLVCSSLVCSNKKEEKSIYDIGFRYLNGNYQKVAQFDNSFLNVLPGFYDKQQEIEDYIGKYITEAFIVCQ